MQMFCRIFFGPNREITDDVMNKDRAEKNLEATTPSTMRHSSKETSSPLLEAFSGRREPAASSSFIHRIRFCQVWIGARMGGGRTVNNHR
jgi:hypothetical protein